MQKLPVLCLIAALFLAASPVLSQGVSAADRASDFERVFGRKPVAQKIPFVMSIYIDDIYAGEMDVLINDFTGEIFFPAKRVADFLGKVLTIEAQEELNTFIQRPTIPDPLLQQLGYEFSVDRADLNLNITTPVESRRISYYTISDTSRVITDPEPVVTRVPWSGFINVDGSTQETNLSQLWTPVRMNIEGALTRYDWTYITQGNVDNRFSGDFFRHQLFHENPFKQRRYIIGSLDIQNLNLVRNQNIVGAQVEKNSQFFGGGFRSIDYRYQLFVDGLSKIAIYINGELVSDDTYRGGLVELRNFPLSNGMNRIEYKVFQENELVAVYRDEVINDMAFGGTDSLVYRYSLGVDEADGNNLVAEGSYLKRRSPYKANGPAFSLDHRASFFGFEERQVFSKGFITTDLGMLRNSNKDLTFGFSTSFLGYRRPFMGSGTWNPQLVLRNFGNDFENRFSNSGNLFVHITPSVQVNFRTGLFMIFATTYEEFHDQRDSFDFRTNLGIPYRNVIYNVLFRTFQTVQGEESWEIRYGFNYVANNRRSFLENEVNKSGRKQSRLILAQDAFAYGDYLYDANLTMTENDRQDLVLGVRNDIMNFRTGVSRFSDDALQLNQNLNLNTNKGIINTTLVQSTEQDTAFPTRVAFSTAVAFVGKHWGFTRRINQGFAILAPEDDLEGYNFNMQRSTTKGWGDAVVSAIQPYQTNSLYITESTIPAGMSLESRYFNVSPARYSGILVKAKRKQGMMAKGRLMTPDNEPLTQYNVFLTPIIDGEPDGTQAILTFTNSKGRFVLEGLKPGRYQISLPSTKYDVAEIDVEASASNYVNLKTIIIKERDYE